MERQWLRYLGAGATGVLLWGLARAAGAETHAFVGAEIIPIVGNPIAEGTLVVTDGEIVAVGSRTAVGVPARVLRVTGRQSTPRAGGTAVAR